MKRFLDFFVASVALIILFPLLLLIYFLVAVTSEGPALFTQVRMGENNKEFYIYKFRTMKMNTPNIATNDFHDCENYITKVGKLLRKTSLDELPQLFNILNGTMSFVGPRPVIIEEKEVIRLRTICGVHKVTPGLTGWAQVNGRDTIGDEEKVQLDYEYATKRTILMDFKIILLTFIKVFKQSDIRQPNNSELVKQEYIVEEDIQLLEEDASYLNVK